MGTISWRAPKSEAASVQGQDRRCRPLTFGRFEMTALGVGLIVCGLAVILGSVAVRVSNGHRGRSR
jgi:hypothetical protein